MAAQLPVKFTGKITAQNLEFILNWTNVTDQLDQQDRSLTSQIPDKSWHSLVTFWYSNPVIVVYW